MTKNLDYVTNVGFLSHITTILLPMILVRNQIRNMLGGVRGKITLPRIKYEFMISSNKNTSMVLYMVHWKGADFEVVFVNFMTVFVMPRVAACS